MVRNQSLAIVEAQRASVDAAGTHVHLSFGRIVDALAKHFRQTYLCVPLIRGNRLGTHDYRLTTDRIRLIPQPVYGSMMTALPHVIAITRAYLKTARAADIIFVRGLIPFVAHLYAAAWLYRRPTCHWIVGNPVELLKTHRRTNVLVDSFSACYARLDRVCTRWGRWLTGGAFICNGEELGRTFRSPRTLVAVSSTITDDEFYERPDTCTDATIELLFIGFPRPEKGLQYLIEALPRLKLKRPWRLTIVGASEPHGHYQQQLVHLAEQRGVSDRIRWVGYVTYGPDMFVYLRQADILILPTLSEGTPRVLVEARANSLPIIATNVGGIPTSVTDGHDGLLVPPKDPDAIARAIERIVEDGELRRSLIRNGLQTARGLTVERFVERILRVLEE